MPVKTVFIRYTPIDRHTKPSVTMGTIIVATTFAVSLLVSLFCLVMS